METNGRGSGGNARGKLGAEGGVWVAESVFWEMQLIADAKRATASLLRFPIG